MKKLLNLKGAQPLNLKEQQIINGGGSAANCSNTLSEYYHCTVVLNGICSPQGICFLP